MKQPKKQGKYSPTQMLRVHGGFADRVRELAAKHDDSVVGITRTIYYAWLAEEPTVEASYELPADRPLGKSPDRTLSEESAPSPDK